MNEFRVFFFGRLHIKRASFFLVFFLPLHAFLSFIMIMNIVDFPVQHLIKIVSNLLDSMLKTNNRLPTTQITYFHSRAIPNISVLSYLTRIHKFAPFTNEALLSMLIYFDRMTKLDDGFTINSYNIHRLLITR